MISPPGAVYMKRGVLKPVAYSSISNPCGTCNCAPSGRATTLGRLSEDGVAKGAGSFASNWCTCANRLPAIAKMEKVNFSIVSNFSVQDAVRYILVTMRTKLAIALLLPAALLLAQPDKTAWDVLKQGLDDKNPDRRRQAITAMASIGLAPDAVARIEQAVQDKEPLVHQTAAAEPA